MRSKVVRMPDELIGELEHAAQALMISQSAVVRIALKRFIEAQRMSHYAELFTTIDSY